MPRNLYDDLDILYREIWGSELHHGLWQTPKDSIRAAKQNLATLVLEHLRPKGKIADIGCGYGCLAQRMVDQFNCSVVACTNSEIQASKIKPARSLTVVCGDWMKQDFPKESFDGAVAVESLSHFPSFSSFLDQTTSLLKPGSNLVIADWFSDSGDHPLLQHLANSGDLPPWRSKEILLDLVESRGFSLVDSRDLSEGVAPTWTKLFLRTLSLPFRKPGLMPVLIKKLLSRPSLLWAFPLLRLAYHSGDLNYHLICLRKENSPRASR